jgi:hypothetical protein
VRGAVPREHPAPWVGPARDRGRLAGAGLDHRRRGVSGLRPAVPVAPPGSSAEPFIGTTSGDESAFGLDDQSQRAVGYRLGSGHPRGRGTMPTSAWRPSVLVVATVAAADHQYRVQRHRRRRYS